MNIVETFRIALTALGTNRLRALLTTLGIVIGVASVVSLMSLGGSLQDYVQSQFVGLGADVLRVSSARTRGTATGVMPLTTSDVAGLQEKQIAAHVASITAIYQVQTAVVSGANSLTTAVQGVTPNYAEINNWFPSPGGSFITQEDVDNAARVVLLDSTTAEDLFDRSDVVGQTLMIGGQVFTVIGVLEERSTGFSSQAILIPISTAQTRLANAHVAGRGYRVSQIQAKASEANAATINLASAEIKAYLLQAHDISNPNAADFTITTQATVLDSLSSTLSLLTVFLSAIAGISLLVGGIGVMNIMLVSVTERTREIGLRKAVGAQASTILSQFLFESLLLSLLGGALGLVTGGLVLLIAGQLVPEMPIALTPASAALATGISSLIGILSGAYPARRAANMHPIQALRFE